MNQDDYKAKLVGYVLEGELDVRSIDGVNYDNYLNLYIHGRNLWNTGKASRYVIAIVANEMEDGSGAWHSVAHVRPDRDNFADPGQCRYLIELWKRERVPSSMSGSFGGAGWMKFHDKLFAEDYGFPIGQA